MPAPIPDIDRTTERQLAAGLFNDTWRLLALPDRTVEQTDEMIHCAHASRYHWGRVGEAANVARGEWLCARVYAVLGRGEPALWHARRCLAIVESTPTGQGEIEDWDLANAYEALGRASAAAGDREAARRWIRLGHDALALVTDAEDRDIVGKDLDSIAI